MTEPIGPKEALARMTDEGHAYVDVRTVAEFEAGHPRGAYNLPLLVDGPSGRAPNDAFVAAASTAFPKDGALVVGCLAATRSMRAAALLEAAGFTRVVVQRAGWGGVTDAFGRVTEKGWRAEGLPTATEAEPGRSWAELAARLATRSGP